MSDLIQPSGTADPDTPALRQAAATLSAAQRVYDQAVRELGERVAARAAAYRQLAGAPVLLTPDGFGAADPGSASRRAELDEAVRDADATRQAAGRKLAAAKLAHRQALTTARAGR